jgi:hypothetical protein
MRNFNLPSRLDFTMKVDIIIVMDGSVLFRVGYHSWIIATTDEDILMAGCGPDDGAQDQRASYRSELGGISAKIGVLGTLARSGMIRILGVTLICDNLAAVLSSKRDLTPSVFHRIESDFDMIATIKYLEKEWCRDIIISYSWVRGHADRLDKPLTRNERLNIEADTIADQIWMEACGPRGTRPQCNHWGLERFSLSIEGGKGTGHMKQNLRSQLHDGDMRYYLRLKEEWTPFAIESVAWDACGTVFR